MAPEGCTDISYVPKVTVPILTFNVTKPAVPKKHVPKVYVPKLYPLFMYCCLHDPTFSRFSRTLTCDDGGQTQDNS